MTVVGQVEQNEYCLKVLERHWPDAPRHNDVRTAADWWLQQERPHVDLVCGGFPCQDISNLGKRRGIQGPKSSLWKEMLHVVRVLRPKYVLIENVAALMRRGLNTVLCDLHECGFDAEWSVISACSVGAPHTRKRLFVVAYPKGEWGEFSGGVECAEVGNSERDLRYWEAKPEPHRVVDGLPYRVDRNRALGNAVVPQVSECVGRLIIERGAT